ncbi:MAG: hypothetical protein WKF80_12750 [Thermomicrobiales bacterium]
MAYADLAAVKAILGIMGTAEDARLGQISDALSLAFDEATGLTFGTVATTSTREVNAPGVSTLLVLTEPIRTVIGIETDGSWNGAAWAGGTTLATDEYRLVYGDAAHGYYGITGSGLWYGTVRVTGQWANTQVAATTPADVTYVVTYAVARQYRAEKADNDGTLGPDGFAVQVPAATNFGLWDKTVAKYRAPLALVV